ncbi:MAG: YdeI/OmpD-associated family protein [Acidobacteriota bacterium]|nr:YdeI/OmpD-associated family protein [Acidobacteriota bacterium]
MKPTFFAKPSQFRSWLSKHHKTAHELLVGFYKKDSGKPSITWPESVDEALCVGWIDGVRKSLGDEAYTIRFTPRRKGSIWSAVNIKRAGELTKDGLMRPAGLAAFERRDEKKSAIYSYEQRKTTEFDPAYEKKCRANKKAWAFFEAQPPWYQRVVRYRVMSAKNEATRLRRLEMFIQRAAKGTR